jgi:hypothetical protein
MAFQLKNQTTTYRWPAVVEYPIDGGKFDKETFDVEFKRVAQDRLREIGVQIDNGDITDNELVNQLVVGWAGISDEKGDDLPFSQSALEQLLNVPLVASAIAAAWLESLAKGKRKN